MQNLFSAMKIHITERGESRDWDYCWVSERSGAFYPSDVTEYS